MSISLDQFVRDRNPDVPLEIIFPDRLTLNAQDIVGQFGGRVLYAVKCNPQVPVLQAIWNGGVRHFDVASFAEIALVRDLFPEAGIHFMHPVKSRQDISRAVREFGVSTFAVDSASELDKVLEVTDGQCPLDVFVRLALPKGQAGRDLSGKFGIDAEEVATLLNAARPHVRRLGLTFHVGSQCLDPQAYVDAMTLAYSVERASGISLDVLDVGGGFPSAYEDCIPPAFSVFANAIAQVSNGTELWCEPGRVLAAPGIVLIAQVLSRKGESLFLNDGLYGGLSPEPVAGYHYAVTLITADGRKHSEQKQPFVLFGPTCDSHDRLPTPYRLPQNIAEGDWIALDNAGAYAGALRSRFNGMGAAERFTWEG